MCVGCVMLVGRRKSAYRYVMRIKETCLINRSIVGYIINAHSECKEPREWPLQL